MCADGWRSSGYTGALFGVSAGIFAVFFFSGVPKVSSILEVCYCFCLLAAVSGSADGWI